MAASGYTWRVSMLADLTVVSTRFLLVLAFITTAAWISTLRRRRRRASHWRRITSAVAAALLTLVLVADGFNSYYSYLPNVSDVVDEVVHRPPPQLEMGRATTKAPVPAQVRGQLATLVIPDDGSGFGKTRAWVWLPPQYFSQPMARFPVVYLFHGSPGMQKDWFHGGAADVTGRFLARQDLPVIEVAPQMSRNWLDDPECVDGIHERVETHLVRDVIPAVDRSFRTIKARSGRIFGGMSAGGYCALNLGLRHRELTATILDLSGFTAPTHAGGLKTLFGRDESALAASNTPASYASSLEAGPQTRIWLDCGTVDRTVLHQMQSITSVLRAAGLTVQLHTRPGDHTYSVWRPALRESLHWALRP